MSTCFAPWRNAVSADLALPEVAGQRPIGMRLNNAFADRVLTAVETAAVVAGAEAAVREHLAPPARSRSTSSWSLPRCSGSAWPSAACWAASCESPA